MNHTLTNTGGNASATSSIFETGSVDSDDENTIAADHPLLSEPADGAGAHVVHAQGAGANVTPINLPTLLLRTPMDVRKPMIIVCCAMLGQQVSGATCLLSPRRLLTIFRRHKCNLVLFE
jgi:hypothetical protein